jgi:hypothetical protein
MRITALRLILVSVVAMVCALTVGISATIGDRGVDEGPWGSFLPQPAPQSSHQYSAVERVALASLLPGRASPASAAVVSAHGRTILGGKVLSITSYRNSSNERCFGPRFPGSQAIVCLTDAQIQADGPVIFYPGGRQARDQLDPSKWDTAWIYGFAAPRVVHLEVLFANCAVQSLGIDHDGYFFVLLPAKLLYGKGLWPYRLIARDSARRLIRSRLVNLDSPDLVAGGPHPLGAGIPKLATNCR